MTGTCERNRRLLDKVADEGEDRGQRRRRSCVCGRVGCLQERECQLRAPCSTRREVEGARERTEDVRAWLKARSGSRCGASPCWRAVSSCRACCWPCSRATSGASALGLRTRAVGGSRKVHVLDRALHVLHGSPRTGMSHWCLARPAGAGRGVSEALEAVLTRGSRTACERAGGGQLHLPDLVQGSPRARPVQSSCTQRGKEHAQWSQGRSRRERLARPASAQRWKRRAVSSWTVRRR